MSSSFPPRRFRGTTVILATLGVVAVLAGLGYFSRMPPRPRVVAAPRLAQPAPVGQPALAGATAADPARGARSGPAPLSSAGSARTSRPAPAAVNRAFPSITETPPDWRDFRPESVTVAPYPEFPVKFTRTALRDEGRYVTWIGRNPEMPGASLVTVATARGYDAILVLPGVSEFSYHVRGDAVVATEAAPGDDSCGVDPIQPPKTAVPVSLGAIYAVTYAPGHEPLPDNFAETAALKVDVLVAYDADTLAAAATKSSDPTGYIDGQMKARFETSNLALAQSGVTAFAWRYLGSVAAPAYPRDGKTQTDMNAIASGGVINDWVKTKRYQYGADQFVLLLGGEMDFGGRGSSLLQTAIYPDSANAVVRWTSSFQTLAHELSHNFGCQHDRAHYNVLASGVYGDPVPDGNGYWCYGQMWTNPPIPGGADPGTSGTVMSYGDYRIPYFSNPSVSVHVTGLLVGWSWDPELGTHQTGLAESNPKAAYNVRVLNDQALAMSNNREEVVLPAITEQPANLSVERGRSFALTVKATGGGLAYQWLKGGVAISGATAGGITKIAEDSDAGTYSVTITNLAGTVTSSSATLTVTVPPPPAPAPSAGGGGGGGAPSLWFLGLLGLGALSRWWAARRN